VISQMVGRGSGHTPGAVTQPEALWGSGTKSGGLTVVISQYATESLAALNLTGCAADCLACLNHPVVEPLVISLRMKEVRNTLPPNTKSAKCTIPGTRSSADEFMFTEFSTSSARIFVGVGCLGRRTGLVSSAGMDA
jgi:hypothetical protein